MDNTLAMLMARKGGGADWNASEGEDGYVKNRTHYAEYAEKTVEAITGASNLLEGFPVFEAGDTVTIKVDGVEYSLVAFDENGLAVIGDSSEDLEYDKGELGWGVFCSSEYNAVAFACFLSNHTVSFIGEIVHKLDKKFLPETELNLLNGIVIRLVIDPEYAKTNYVYRDNLAAQDNLPLSREDFFSLIPFDDNGEYIPFTVVLCNRYGGMEHTAIAADVYKDECEFHILDVKNSGIPTVYYTHTSTDVPVPV